jgi:hypothetical protein
MYLRLKKPFQSPPPHKHLPSPRLSTLFLSRVSPFCISERCFSQFCRVGLGTTKFMSFPRRVAASVQQDRRWRRSILFVIVPFFILSSSLPRCLYFFSAHSCALGPVPITGNADIRSRAQPIGINVTVSVGSSDFAGLGCILPTSPR